MGSNSNTTGSARKTPGAAMRRKVVTPEANLSRSEKVVTVKNFPAVRDRNGVGSPFRKKLTPYVMPKVDSKMTKGHNTCKWLDISKKELCGRSCLGEYCGIHLMLLRRGSCTKLCMSCGVGVTNKEQLCVPCRYQVARRRHSRQMHREFRGEFKRLATIKISN